jgi:hypothetical protein
MSDLNLVKRLNGYILQAVVTNEQSGAALTGATVTATLVEKGTTTDVDVAGQTTWPVTLPETSTLGTYESAVLDARDFTDQTVRKLDGICTVDAGGVPGTKRAPIHFIEP